MVDDDGDVGLENSRERNNYISKFHPVANYRISFFIKGISRLRCVNFANYNSKWIKISKIITCLNKHFACSLFNALIKTKI